MPDKLDSHRSAVQTAAGVCVRGVSEKNLWPVPCLAGTLLFFCALTFYYFAVIRIDYSRTMLLDLGPYPDAVEYFAQAKALLKDGWPSIQIGYDKLPSRYPFGYPALMLPWLKALPEGDCILAPFRTNQTVGLLLLVGVFGFYSYLAKPLMGGLAAVLLATLPAFFTFCRSSLSEISALALIVVAFMFAYLGLTGERRWKIYLSAAFLGLSVNIRLQGLFFAPLLLAMALFLTKGMRSHWFFHCAALPIVFALAVSPALLINTIQFHSPFKTGYDFWTPEWTENHLLYLQTNIAQLWREFVLRRNEYSVANIFGTGTSFVPAFILLVWAGLFFIRLDRFVISASLAGLTFFAMIVSFTFADARLYLPLLVLLVPVAVLPVTWATKNLFSGKRTIAALAILVLFAIACLGYPSQSGYNALALDRCQVWDALHFTTPARDSSWFIAQKRLVNLFGAQPGIVLSDIDPVYLNALLPESFIAAPIDRRHHFKWSTIWRYDRPEAMALVKRGVDQRRPVYALFVSGKEMKASRLPELDGYAWIPVEDPAAEAAILKVTQSSQ
jgi:hypothetical protein